MEPGDLAKRRTPSVYVFNPFSEGYIDRGKAFTPVKHQTMLASDLASLPQFLCEPGDIVLVPKGSSAGFLHTLELAGFPPPVFVELKQGRIDPADNLVPREILRLRPWAWGPDSVELLQPLFDRVAGEAPGAAKYSNQNLARLYSKAWSADFLRKVLARIREGPDSAWLCSERESGVAAGTFAEALKAVDMIRRRGHHRVVVKEALGLAGHNALRLWEPDILPPQRRWLANSVCNGRQVVVEPWLERDLDFSIQLEMESSKLRLCGYTGLLNDLKGQFLGNWAEAHYTRHLPVKVAELLGAGAGISEHLDCVYGEVLSLLQTELERARYVGPVSIDAFVYRSPQGERRLKPVVEINPRYTMGRLTVELMKHVCPGGRGQLRLVNKAQARAQGFADFAGYARSLSQRCPLKLERGPQAKIKSGALCLNDPTEAQVCLATFEAGLVQPLPQC